MNVKLHIIGIFLSGIFIGVIVYFSEEVAAARWDYLYNDWGGSLLRQASNHKNLTITASLWSLVFFLVSIGLQVWGLVKVKTVTTKVVSIIGLSVSLLFILWDFMVIANPGSISFDEVSPGWIFYALIWMAFMIVGLVQSVIVENQKNKGRETNEKDDLDELDY